MAQLENLFGCATFLWKSGCGYAIMRKSLKKGENYISKKGLLLCISVFMVNGGVSTVSKLPQINSLALSSLDFTFWLTACNLLLSFVLNVVIGVYKRKESEETTDEKIQNDSILKKIFLILCMTVISCTGTICQQIGAKTIDAGMLFPMTSGGTIVLITLLGNIFFKEKKGIYENY